MSHRAGRARRATTPDRAGPAQKVVLDCDTGTDDAVAIMLAALPPRG